MTLCATADAKGGDALSVASAAMHDNTASFEVGVGVDWRAGSAAGPVRIVAKPLLSEGTGPDLAVVQAFGNRLRLRKGAWSIGAERAGFWIPAEVVAVVANGQSVRLSAWPTGRVRGRLASLPASEIAALRKVSLGFAAGPAETAGPPAGVVPCSLDGAVWECEVPAAKLDLQLSVPGFAIRYEWDREVIAGGLADLGAAVLRRGGSVVGWIEDARGGSPGSDATVALSALDSAAGEIGGTAVTCNRRGFFQMVGVPAGSYLLRARKPGMATTTATIRVVADAETRLAQPIVLAPPAALSISVDPPLGPDGGTWTVEVVSIREGRPESVAREPLTREGRWRRAGLAGGRHHVTVSSSEGQQWWGEEVELESGAARELAVRLAIVTVRGTVSLGGRPLPDASVSFGGVLSPVRLSAQSDSAGSFSLRLPRPGTWTVDVEAAEPRVHRSLRAVEVELTGPGEARVDVALTDAAVKGYVRDDAGLPVVAHVRAILDGGADAIVVSESGPDGAFELRGLVPGPATLVANARGGLVSSPISVKVAERESEQQPVELIVRREHAVRGVVFSSEGAVPGARVAAFPVPLGSPVVPVSTDDEGRFEVRVPPAASELVIAVSAIGYGYKMVRHQLVSDEPLQILLEPGGGTLRVVLPNQPDAVLNAFVLHGGGFSGLMALRHWAVQNGSGAQIGPNISVPRMPPGAYTVCLGGRVTLQDALQATSPPDTGTCASGTLVEGGELELRLAP